MTGWPPPKSADAQVFVCYGRHWFYQVRRPGGHPCWWPAGSQTEALRRWHYQNGRRRLG